MIFFSYLIDFSYFLLNFFSKCFRIQSEQVKMTILKEGIDGFSYLSLIFSYFYFNHP
jgi:hypothetical protein